MTAYFFDTSALVKRYVHETGSNWVLSIADPTAGNELFVLRLTELEATSAIIRRFRGGTLSSADATVALTYLQYDFIHQYQIVEVGLPLVSNALSLVHAHSLRAYDALHLAVALQLHSQRAALGLPPLIMVCADLEINNAASLEGLLIEDPNSYP